VFANASTLMFVGNTLFKILGYYRPNHWISSKKKKQSSPSSLCSGQCIGYYFMAGQVRCQVL